MKKVIWAIPAVLMLVGCGAYSLKEVEALRADKAARTFANSLGYTSAGCSGQDSTSDGYVTCTLKDTAGQIVEAECSYNSSEAGCKPKSKK